LRGLIHSSIQSFFVLPVNLSKATAVSDGSTVDATTASDSGSSCFGAISPRNRCTSRRSSLLQRGQSSYPRGMDQFATDGTNVHPFVFGDISPVPSLGSEFYSVPFGVFFQFVSVGPDSRFYPIAVLVASGDGHDFNLILKGYAGFFGFQLVSGTPLRLRFARIAAAAAPPDFVASAILVIIVIIVAIIGYNN